jgi:hypothetical protein
MHENAGIDSDNVLMETCHGFPPISLYVVFEFNTHLTIIINGSQTVIDFAGREYETILLAMGNQNLEKFFLCHLTSFILLRMQK